MGSIFETSEIVGTLTADTGAQLEPIRDDPISQAMLRMLERVVGTRTGPTT